MTAITIPACPIWCARRTDHEYDGYLIAEPSKQARSHPVFGDHDTTVNVYVQETNDGRTVELGEPYIVIWAGDENLSLEAARKVSADLLAAMAKLEELQRQS